jgi:hypothetical protein
MRYEQLFRKSPYEQNLMKSFDLAKRRKEELLHQRDLEEQRQRMMEYQEYRRNVAWLEPKDDITALMISTRGFGTSSYSSGRFS